MLIVPANTAFFTFASELLTKRAFSVPDSLNTPMLSFGDHKSPVTPSRYTVGSMQVRVSAPPSSMTAVMNVSLPMISFSAMSAQEAIMAPAMRESSARAALSNVFPVMIR